MPEPGTEDKVEEGAGVSKEADAIIAAVKESLKSKEETPAPDSQPKPVIEDSQKQYQAWREETKKKMGWNDEQVNYHEKTIREAQAPLIKDSSILKLKTSQKDYDVLEKAFLAEVGRYEKAGRIIDPTLAEELFYKVKGAEITAGRYTIPDSQPQKKVGAQVDRTPSRIARGYDAASPGMSGGSADEKSDANLSQEENDMAEFVARAADQIGMTVTKEDYVKGREEKKAGRRAITDKTVQYLEVDRNANSADRDLASLRNRNATVKR